MLLPWVLTGMAVLTEEHVLGGCYGCHSWGCSQLRGVCVCSTGWRLAKHLTCIHSSSRLCGLCVLCMLCALCYAVACCHCAVL